MRSGEFLLTGSQINQLFITERDLSIQIGFPWVNDFYAVLYGSEIENSCYEDTYSFPIKHQVQSHKRLISENTNSPLVDKVTPYTVAASLMTSVPFH